MVKVLLIRTASHFPNIIKIIKEGKMVKAGIAHFQNPNSPLKMGWVRDWESIGSAIRQEVDKPNNFLQWPGEQFPSRSR